MRRIHSISVYCALFCMFLTQASSGRVVSDLPYDELVDRADVIVIARMGSSKQEHVDLSSISPWGRLLQDPELNEKIRASLIAEVSTFRVITCIKGNYHKSEIKVFHLTSLHDTNFLENGPYLFRRGLVKGGAKTEAVNPEPATYLLFLKRYRDDRFEPVTGQFDSAFSIREIRNLAWDRQEDSPGLSKRELDPSKSR